MVILLKLFCLAIWVMIIISLIPGLRISQQAKKEIREVSLYIEDYENIEMILRKTLQNMKAEETLVIRDIGGNKPSINRQIINRMIKKNPAILYFPIIENGGFLY